MENDQTDNLLTLAVLIARAYPEIEAYKIPRTLAKLQRLAIILHNLHKRHEAECSYPWADADEYQARTAKLERHAATLAWGELGLVMQVTPKGQTILWKGKEP
jgi:hypothetical protein